MFAAQVGISERTDRAVLGFQVVTELAEWVWLGIAHLFNHLNHSTGRPLAMALITITQQGIDTEKRK